MWIPDIFYKEWLQLPPQEFRTLAMIAANGGSYTGTLSDMCKYLNLKPQSKNKAKLKASISSLEQNSYIHSSQNDNKFSLEVIPKETIVKSISGLAASILWHEYASTKVSPANLLRVYIWIVQNYNDLAKNAQICMELNISESTLCAAKNVLKNEYKVLFQKRVSEKVNDSFYIYKGQLFETCAFYHDPQS